VTLSKTGGYEIKTFDLFGRLKFHELNEREMPEQQPQKVMEIFQNFRGYANHFILCKKIKSLPFRALGESGECELLYSFDADQEFNDQVQIGNQQVNRSSIDLIWTRKP
jgi:hypothetical protein